MPVTAAGSKPARRDCWEHGSQLTADEAKETLNTLQQGFSVLPTASPLAAALDSRADSIPIRVFCASISPSHCRHHAVAVDSFRKTALKMVWKSKASMLNSVLAL